MPLGASRVGGPIIDYPKNEELPADLFFVAALKLEEFAIHDKSGRLPKTGILYFFIGEGGDSGLVRYFEDSSVELVRHEKEHDRWFWDGCLIDSVSAETEEFESRYYDDPDDGRSWSSFAGTDDSKIFGIYTHCQRLEDEIRDITNSSKVLLLQVGENFTGEGVWSVLIEEDDLENLDFSRCEFAWGQS